MRGVSRRLAARHHARALERRLLAARNAHADEFDAFGAAFLHATRTVGKQRIAGVDQDVAAVEQRHEFVDHVVDRLTRLDHDDDDARLAQRGDESAEAVGR
jgi:hypothetical protein